MENLEDQIDRQRAFLRLHEVSLPAGVRLVDRSPVQRRMHGLLQRTFAVVYVDGRMGEVEHIERYEIGLSDEFQMQFALKNLKAKLQRLGIQVKGSRWDGTVKTSKQQPRLWTAPNNIARAAAQLDALGIGRTA